MKRLDWFPWVTIGLVLGLLVYRADRNRQSRDEDRREIRRLTQLSDSLAQRSAIKDTVFRIQRDTFYVRRVTTDTAILSVERWKTDTLRVVQFVAQADSTLRACSAALLTCEQRVALRDQRLAIVSDSLPRAVATEWRGKVTTARQRALTVGVVAGALAALLLAR